MDVKKRLLVADREIADVTLEWFFSKTESDARPFTKAEDALWTAVLERRMLVLDEQLRRMGVL